MAGSNQRVIPREQTTAWERWELASISEEARHVAAEALAPAPDDVAVVEPEALPEVAETDSVVEPPEAPVLPVEVPVDAVPLPTAQELEAIRQQAHHEGFEAGLEAGRRVADHEVARFADVLQSLSALSEETETGIAESILDLALVLARQLVRTQIQADPHSVLPVIRDALGSLPLARAPSRLYLYPDDLVTLGALIAAELPTDVWRLLPDPQLMPGGCRIETSSSQLDLSLTTRWAMQLRVLGRSDRTDLAWSALPAEPLVMPPPPVIAPASANTLVMPDSTAGSDE